jgi:hypothetical protein
VCELALLNDRRRRAHRDRHHLAVGHQLSDSFVLSGIAGSVVDDDRSVPQGCEKPVCLQDVANIGVVAEAQADDVGLAAKSGTVAATSCARRLGPRARWTASPHRQSEAALGDRRRQRGALVAEADEPDAHRFSIVFSYACVAPACTMSVPTSQRSRAYRGSSA